ncbi:MAG: DNA-processing protein DprA, partial [Patescibacteria group bacterium]
MTQNIKRVVFDEDGFPEMLKEIPGAPKELYCLGELPEKGEIAVAIVGTRKLTSEGKIIAK